MHAVEDLMEDMLGAYVIRTDTLFGLYQRASLANLSIELLTIGQDETRGTVHEDCE
jgi:hypothetical protein